MDALTPLQILANLRGLSDDYVDYKGQPSTISADRKAAILSAMGYSVDPDGIAKSLEQATEQAAQQKVPPVVVLRPDSFFGFTCRACPDVRGTPLEWTVHFESGGSLSGKTLFESPADSALKTTDQPHWIDCDIPFVGDIPLGYHRLVASWNEGVFETLLIQTPETSYRPDSLAHGERIWGPSIQLYTLRSERNWGIGDFTDLAELVESVSALGAGFVGLNPLHALYPVSPEHASPYSPSNRNWLNSLYIDPTQVPEFLLSDSCQQWFSSEAITARLHSVRASQQVDYSEVSSLKWAAFNRMYEGFVATHLALGTARAKKFEAFVEAGGATLRAHAVFDALLSYFYAQDNSAWGWPMWPTAYQNPRDDAVLAFEAAHQDAIQKHLYVQFVAKEQLQAVHDKTSDCGMALGLYRDLAVGADRGGSEVWQDPSAFCIDASVGAPPDALGPIGQNWGLPPFDPAQLHATGYHHFITLIRSNMQSCGALRMDHAMALARLWWCPPGETAAEGCYVSYPFDDLLGIVLLESHRQHCLVIAEDLGTVPDIVRVAFPKAELYSNKVFYFEIGGTDCTAPQDYPANALAIVANHDMPTVAAFWEGADLDLRHRLGLFASDDVWQQERTHRLASKVAVMGALCKQGFLSDADLAALGGLDAVLSSPITAALNSVIHQYLASTPTQLVAVQLEDVLLLKSPVNVPGTSHEYDNWRRKLTVDTKKIFAQAPIQAFCRQIDLRRKQPL